MSATSIDVKDPNNPSPTPSPSSTAQTLPQTPERGANPLSRVSWWWLNSLMFKGIHTPLEQKDCYELLPQYMADEIGREFEAEWKQKKLFYVTAGEKATNKENDVNGHAEVQKESVPVPTKEEEEGSANPAAAAHAPAPVRGPTLAAVFYRMYKKEFWLAAVAKAIADGLTLLQPMLLNWLLTFLVDWYVDGLTGGPRPPEWHGIVLSVFLGVAPFVSGSLENLHLELMTLMGFKIRTALVQAMYRKSLFLSSKARAQHSQGKIVNVMSSDTFLLDQFLQYIHLCWAAVAMIIVAVALLINAIGWPAVIGLLVIIASMPFAGWVMVKWMTLYAVQAPIKDARVKRMNEILQCIRVIKMYVWEGAFLDLLKEVRDKELEVIEAAQIVNVGATMLWTATPVLISLVAFITLGLTSDNFDTASVFAALALFNILRMPLIMAPAAMAQGASAAVALTRVQDFLLAEELQWLPTLHEADKLIDDTTGKTLAVQMKDACFKWHAVEQQADDKTAKAKDEKNEKQPADEKNQDGKDDKKSATIAKNGTGSSVGSEGSTAPKSDDATSVTTSGVKSEEPVAGFKLEHLDLTIPRGLLVCVVGSVGSGKSSLLGALLGEMERTNGFVDIAGTVAYCAQIACIINASVRENVLFGREFDSSKYADAVKFAALTHDLEILPHGDRTDIGERGINLSGGQKARVALARAIFASTDTLLLDDPLSAVDAHVGQLLFHQCIREYLAGRTRVLVTHQLQFVRHADHVIMMDGGRIAEQGSYDSLMATEGGKFRALLEEFGGKEEEKKQGETEKHGAKSADGATASSDKGVEKSTDAAAVQKLMEDEDHAKGSVALSVYLYYLEAGGGWLPLFGLILFMIISCGVQTYNSWWLSDWTDDKYNKSTNFYVGIYSAISLGGMVFTAISMLFCRYMSVRASRELHERSVRSVIRAPTSFFDTTPIGRILNRFSRDQSVIDDQIMRMLQNVGSIMFSLVGILIIIAIVTPWILIPFAIVTIVYVQVERAFRNSNRELKRLESIARSPLYAHFAETLTGLSTIRAYRMQNVFLQSHMSKLNSANSPTYLQLQGQRWLSMRVETISAIVSFFSAILVFVQRDTISAGQAGVAVSYAISLPPSLNWLVRCTAEAEAGMNSVERAKFYSDELPQEKDAKLSHEDHSKTVGKKSVATGLMSGGSITFEQVRMRYRLGLPEVLKGVNFTVRPRERVGVVGRTGSGKSSLMVALYRLVEISELGNGTIRIDGSDISKLGLDDLRATMSIIAQDPVLFAGTIRSNLDPFNTATDDEVWLVLERAHLAATVRGFTGQLSEPVLDGGENLSLGQRCQVCLARAMLRHARILIMDEATASVDMATDSLIQQSLRRDFSDRTLLTIAHRLHTIIDYDRVLVMADGEVAEFDTPAKLLRNPKSAFFKMVADTGAANAQLLTRLAFQAEKGIKISVDQFAEGAALAPDAESAELDSPSLIRPSYHSRLGPDEEVSRIHWHEGPQDEEEMLIRELEPVSANLVQAAVRRS